MGCGIGRLAIPLTRYLEDGSYEGLDIVPSGIRWCNEHTQHQNFRFRLADIFNKEYNPSGRLRASQYTFPYPDHSFDVIVLVSVFTHMLPDDTEQYVGEIPRVLRSHGRCYATYYLINPDARRLMESGQGSLRFKHDLGTYWTVYEKVPELSIAYEEGYIRELYAHMIWS
jgi:SAM-dependent methyltransferase